jgi:hypothetical protein
VVIGQPGTEISLGGIAEASHFTGAASFAGNDEFIPSKRLQNGWSVVQVELRQPTCAAAGFSCALGFRSNGASVVASRPGSDSPYVKVRWWMDRVFPIVGSNSLSCNVAITITGPKGLPHR